MSDIITERKKTKKQLHTIGTPGRREGEVTSAFCAPYAVQQYRSLHAMTDSQR